MCDAGFKPKLIINMDPSHSEMISGYQDLTEFAEQLEIDVYRPYKYNLKSQEDIDALSKCDIDVLLVFGWQRLIPEWLIDQCQKGVFGVHGGPEKPPRCRGRAVFNWAMIMGYDKFYLYLFKITPDIDSGDIIDIREFDINQFDDIATLYNKNCILTSQMIIDNISSIIDGTVVMSPQADETPTFLPKRTPDDGEIFWDKDSNTICRLIRALTKPYPGAYTHSKGKQVFIYNAHLFDTKIKFKGVPGQISEVFDTGEFVVITGDYPLYVRSYSNNFIPCKGDIFEYKKNVEIIYPTI